MSISLDNIIRVLNYLADLVDNITSSNERRSSQAFFKRSWKGLLEGFSHREGGGKASVKIKNDYSQYIMFRYSRIYILLRLAGW